MLEQLADIVLLDDSVKMQVMALLSSGRPVVVKCSVGEDVIGIALKISGNSKGERELLGYELWKKRKVELPLDFNEGTAIGKVEKLFRAISIPEVLPRDFMSRREENELFDQLAPVLLKFHDLELYVLGGGNDDQFDQLIRMKDILLVQYGSGNGLGDYLMGIDKNYWKDKFYEVYPFPPSLNAGVVINRINDTGKLRALSELTMGFPNNKFIMNLNNLENLREEMNALGFKAALIEQMEEKMKANVTEFKLYDAMEATRGRVDVGLYFKQSGQSDYYYLNKFEVIHEKGQPIKEGEKIMVLTQMEGADKGMTKSFVQVSEAIAFFNGQKEMFKENNGVSNLVVGKDANSAVKLATMENGKVNYLQKEFAQTYRTSPINQTIYVEKGKGFSVEQAANLIQGRAVYRDDMVSQAGQQYKAWIKLDFDVPKDRFGNFMLNQYTDPAYGFDLSKVLDKFEIKELGDPAKREILEGSIRNGNRVLITVEKNGEPIKLELEAVPRYSQINLYTKEGRPEKREQFLKQPDLKQEYAQNMNKAQEKNKKQGQGLRV